MDKNTYSGKKCERCEDAGQANHCDSTTEKQGHTPGPWEAVKDSRNGVILCDKVNSYGNHHIARYDRGDFDGLTDEDFANAKLIAAAPDLLAACKRALVDLQWKESEDNQTQTYNQWRAYVDNLAAAIEKAETL